MLIFTGLPLLGMLIVMGLGALTAKNGVAGGRPRHHRPVRVRVPRVSA